MIGYAEKTSMAKSRKEYKKEHRIWAVVELSSQLGKTNLIELKTCVVE